MPVGFNLAANGGYDFVNAALQYAGVQAVYNWNCCGLSLGYRRFALGSVRDETQYLYSFTLANFGSVGDIRRSNTVFHDPPAPLPTDESDDLVCTPVSVSIPFLLAFCGFVRPLISNIAMMHSRARPGLGWDILA